MRASIIVRSKDEAYRLRLTLASLARQSVAAEVIVVNDGSRDHTRQVVAQAELPVVYVEHEQPAGRAAATNAGAKRAGGDVLIFLDGDTLAEPGLVAAHLAAHRQAAGAVVARGETYNLRCTRALLDPDSGLPMPHEAARVNQLPAAEVSRLRVTLADVAENFGAIAARGVEGIYPGAGPRMLYELEMDALRRHPDCTVLWAAASGANASVSAAAFRDVGGFNPRMAINAHREFAYRMCQAGARMAPAIGARNYHMIHRAGWRDPLVDTGWEAEFYRLHPVAAVPLLAVLWRSLGTPPLQPAAARITSLPRLEAAARACAGIHGIEAVRRHHFQLAMADAAP
jgi:glycosyltransferase involved in cell wall biosynthesis